LEVGTKVRLDWSRSQDRERFVEVPLTLERWVAYVTTLVETSIDVAALLFVQGDPRIGGEPTIKVLDWPG
jgi:hypothetical protein